MAEKKLNKNRFLNPLQPIKFYYGKGKTDYFYRYSYIAEKLPTIQKNLVSWFFWFCFIIIPFAFYIVFTALRLSAGLTTQEYIQNNTLYIGLLAIFTILVPLIGLAVIMTIDGARIVFNGGVAFFIWYFLFNGINLLIELIIISPLRNNNEITSQTLNTVGIYIQIFLEILVVAIVFSISPQMRFDFKQVFRKLKWKILVWGFVIFLVAIALNFAISAIFTPIFERAGLATSENQTGLESLLGTALNPNIGGIIAIIILTIFVAPFVEELATRHGIFAITSNKFGVFAVLASVIFFSGMHVTAGLDFYNIVLFLGTAIPFAVGFLILKRVFAYTWFAHTFFNLVALIILFVRFANN